MKHSDEQVRYFVFSLSTSYRKYVNLDSTSIVYPHRNDVYATTATSPTLMRDWRPTHVAEGGIFYRVERLFTL
jgi:hypothetical protein